MIRYKAKYDDEGRPDHTVQVTHATFLMVGEAASLQTETATEDFIRNVNAQGIRSSSDTEAISKITEGIISGLKP